MPFMQMPHSVGKWLVEVDEVYEGWVKRTWIQCVPLLGGIKGPTSVVDDGIGKVLSLHDVLWVGAIPLVKVWSAS